MLASTVPASGALGADLGKIGELGKIVMPGEVIQGHADIEAECSNCHRPFQRTEQRTMCLDCHDSVAADIRERTGFHGRKAQGMECRICHTEHIGRRADITGLDRDTFAHTLTDFPLLGRHQRVPCSECHAADSLYREAPSQCVDCHAQDDPHDDSFSNTCQDCHSEDGWKGARFDHDQTSFPLVGKHARVACSLCHPNRQYEGAPKDCYSCHRQNDVHAGSFGRQCEDCHSSRGWDTSDFDHDVDTEFPLRGAHARLECHSCHKDNPHTVKLEKDCYACHRSDDVHKGRFGTSCASCHVSEDWERLTFDHDRTDFPLKGVHRQVACTRCHTEAIGRSDLSTTCRACHVRDDVHAGQQGEDCGQCHRETGWADRVFFDHGLTRFPLLGLHAAVVCEACHESNAFRDASPDCSGCHRDDDFHDRTLGPHCDLCHNPNGWTYWHFDHAEQTDFPLEGAHARQTCRDCHVRRVADRIQMPSTCGSCHQRDDVHLGSYGRDCARCHYSDRWDRVRSDR